jgi:hypothetical protein
MSRQLTFSGKLQQIPWRDAEKLSGPFGIDEGLERAEIVVHAPSILSFYDFAGCER